MNVKTKYSFVILLAIPLVLLGVFVSLQRAKDQKSKVASETGVVQTSAKQSSSTPVAFQPEAQMLSQAMQAGRQNSGASRSAASDHPVTATAGGAAYKYQSQLCQTSADQHFGCLSDYYQGLVSHYGVDMAFADIKQRFKEDSYVASMCHPIMHVVGQEASHSYVTVSEAYLHGDSFCWSGYYHGIMEGVIAQIGRNKLPSALNTICADIPGKKTYNFDYYNCVHGLGHGIMELSQDEVFDSLKMCDNLTGDWERQSCYSGVFMENVIADGKNHQTKYLKPAEPLYPCTAVDGKYKYQCYLGQTSYALQVTGYNFQKIFNLCATVEDPFRDVCNQSMGRDVANQAMHDKDRTKADCFLPTNVNDRTNCVIGAVKEIISYYHSDIQAKDFCNILEEPYKTTCGTTADSYYKNL